MVGTQRQRIEEEGQRGSREVFTNHEPPRELLANRHIRERAEAAVRQVYQPFTLARGGEGVAVGPKVDDLGGYSAQLPFLVVQLWQRLVREYKISRQASPESCSDNSQ